MLDASENMLLPGTVLSNIDPTGEYSSVGRGENFEKIFKVLDELRVLECISSLKFDHEDRLEYFVT
jgi:ABC-type multidrug transport system fused ATPase/permease subunit